MKAYQKFRIISSLLVLLAVLFISACERDDIQKLDARQWQLTWSDDFNGDAGALPDAAKWAFDLGNGEGGWGNQELQSYTNNPENVALDGEGNLLITALRNGNSYTSARITTKGIFTQKYGRFEAKIRTPYGPGIWPAFWMLGENITSVGWPLCGEIDIMEVRGQQPDVMAGSLHGPGYSGGNPVTKKYALVNDRFDADYHLFAVEWNENRIDYFADDYLYQRIDRGSVPGEWVYDQPFYLILNVAVGGNYVGFPTEQTPFPQSMVIDYVKVYKSAE